MSSAPASLSLLFATRSLRMFAYGGLGVVLVLYLTARGLSDSGIGLLLTLTLLGDAAISLALTTRADRWGRRRTLVVGAVLMLLGGGAMAVTDNFFLLALAATIGVISPTGSEVGPFLAVEQACLAQVAADRDRTRIFAWYNVTGFLSTAVGAVTGGFLAEGLQHAGWSALESYRVIFLAYATLGIVIGVMSVCYGDAVEAPVVPRAQPSEAVRPLLGLVHSRGIVFRLSGLFALDAFGGGFVLQSFLVYWFHRKFGVGEATLGTLFFGTNLLSGISALVAVPLARRIGLVNTMVGTHLPSNLLLMLVPFMPTYGWAVTALLLRHVLSQMDVPTRQSYVNAVVPAGERSAANGVTGTARQLGASLAPILAGPLLGSVALAAAPFVVSGSLKIVYDLLLWRSFRRVKPPEEN